MGMNIARIAEQSSDTEYGDRVPLADGSFGSALTGVGVSAGAVGERR